MLTVIASALGLSRAMTGLALAGVALAAIGVAVLWLRADARQDVRDEIERDALKGRIETIEDAKRRRNDAQESDDCTLFERLTGGVRCPSAD